MRYTISIQYRDNPFLGRERKNCFCAMSFVIHCFAQQSYTITHIDTNYKTDWLIGFINHSVIGNFLSLLLIIARGITVFIASASMLSRRSRTKLRCTTNAISRVGSGLVSARTLAC